MRATPRDALHGNARPRAKRAAAKTRGFDAPPSVPLRVSRFSRISRADANPGIGKVTWGEGRCAWPLGLLRAHSVPATRLLSPQPAPRRAGPPLLGEALSPPSSRGATTQAVQPVEFRRPRRALAGLEPRTFRGALPAASLAASPGPTGTLPLAGGQRSLPGGRWGLQASGGSESVGGRARNRPSRAS